MYRLLFLPRAFKLFLVWVLQLWAIWCYGQVPSELQQELLEMRESDQRRG